MIEEETQSKLLAQVPTPRTDAWLKFTFATSDIMRAAPMACQNFADFARGLERENVALREALTTLAQDSECYCADHVANPRPCGYCVARSVLESLAHKKL